MCLCRDVVVLITLCDYVDKLIYSVDNFVKVLYLLCFETWITLLYVRVVRTVLLFCLRVADSDASLCYGHIWWWYCIRYLVCIHHFRYVFGCNFGMSHHFMGKNGVFFGIAYHFWIFRVYSRDGHNRTIFCVWCKDKCFCGNDTI